ncbi:MAG: hypothetical protein ACFFEY_02750 [Candidatus Thorarchaeota archaeon]
MVEAVLKEIEIQEKIDIPEFDVNGKENIDQYFKLLLAGTPRLKFSITDKSGKDLYSNLLNVEMR